MTRATPLFASWPRPAYWTLSVLLMLTSVAVQIAIVRTYLETGGRLLSFQTTGAQGAAGYPLVAVLRTPDSGLQLGDTVLRIGDVDTQGLSSAAILDRTRSYLRPGASVRTEIERDGRRLTIDAAPFPNPNWWASIVSFGVLVLVALFILYRAPHWHLVDLFFVLCLCWFGYGGNHASTGVLVRTLANVVFPSVALGLTLYFFASWSVAAPPGRGLRSLALVMGLTYGLTCYVFQLSTWPVGLLNPLMSGIVLCLFLVLTLALLIRAYRVAAPLERRQLRWILYSHAIGIAPVVALFTLRGILPVDGALWVAYAFIGAIPLGYAVAIVGYGWLDIDRVISASAAATLVGMVLVAALLAVVPTASRLASAALGIDPATAQIALSMVLAAMLVPAYRAVHPRLDRIFFAERHALAGRFERLRADLGLSRGVEDMTTRAGEGFDALMHPDSVVIYGRAGDAFVPLFVRGRTAPAAFETDSTLIRVLEGRGEPLFARAKEIAPFERAALETLGAEVIVPQLRGTQIVAFTCLGAKRSGDIYTATDLALLGSVTRRCAEVIERIDAETLAREAQVMQSALRRFVPGAVAERVLDGDSLEPTEREVTVLFVDLRGYTSLSEGMTASDVFATVNEHTERVSRILIECSGTVVEFNGDGMMAVFGAPIDLPRKELHAVEAARRVVDSMPDSLTVGVGIATGEAFVGSIRSTDRLIWSAVGNTPNLAARLQMLTRDLGATIAVDAVTRERAGYVCTDFQRHESVAVRGRTGRFDVFALPLQAT